MSLPGIKLTLRGPEARDLENLHKMVVESTGGNTKITLDSLSADLLQTDHFKRQNITSSDSCVEFEAESTSPDEPVARAILAEVNDSLVGYLIYHYHYSPWTGHQFYINDIFVQRVFRNKGIAKRLLQKLSNEGKKLNLSSCLFTVAIVNEDLMMTILKREPKWYRNDKTDWSVYRIEFKESDQDIRYEYE